MHKMSMTDASTPPAGSVLIIDYGSQLTQLIARRIRELNIYSEIIAFDTPLDDTRLQYYEAFILSGGPYTSTAADAPALNEKLLQSGKKILAVCYGAQRMALEFGGTVESSEKREFGDTTIKVPAPHVLFKEIPLCHTVWMSHSDRISTVPAHWQVLATTEAGVIAAITDNRNYFAVQFHPEADHSEFGRTLLKNFIFDIAGLRENWNMEYYLQHETAWLSREIGGNKIILALSGGVDSLVSAVLVAKAVGKNLHCIFVDHGLLRKNERQEVEAFIRKNFEFNLMVIDAREEFVTALAGVTDPEQKRKIIGHKFIALFEEAARKHFSDARFLVQGTIYPDIIESAGNSQAKGEVIKSHHNVGGLPEKLNFKIIEPLRMLFKDEVRKLGLTMGIPRALVMRHPFPGPGLAIRIPGEIKEEYLSILREADAILIEELHKNNLYDKTAQAFCVFLPVKTVGVMGDNRTYEYVIAIRVIESNDFMTGRFARLPLEFLEKTAGRIVNEVKGVNRIVYDITNKPPATIEWE
jgi:GMP synthase (glutamine-hydrolysing)